MRCFVVEIAVLQSTGLDLEGLTVGVRQTQFVAGHRVGVWVLRCQVVQESVGWVVTGGEVGGRRGSA